MRRRTRCEQSRTFGALRIPSSRSGKVSKGTFFLPLFLPLQLGLLRPIPSGELEPPPAAKGEEGGTSIHRQRTASSTASGDCSTESVFSYIDAGNKLLQKRFFESENKVSHAFLTQKLAKSALTLRPFHLSPLPLSLSALLLPPPFELKSNKL